jgi:hypothetical protein
VLSSDCGLASVVFEGTEPEILNLGPGGYGSGDADGEFWFHVQPHKEFLAERHNSYTAALQRFSTRSNRRWSPEIGDGHCGFRAAARQYYAQVLGQCPAWQANAITSHMTQEMRGRLGGYIEHNADTLAAQCLASTPGLLPPGETAASKAEEYAEYAKRSRNVDCTKDTWDQDEWFGKFDGVDFKALACVTGMHVHCVTKNAMSVRVYSPSSAVDSPWATEQDLRVVTPGPHDFVLLFNATDHFESFTFVPPDTSAPPTAAAPGAGPAMVPTLYSASPL